MSLKMHHRTVRQLAQGFLGGVVRCQYVEVTEHSTFRGSFHLRRDLRKLLSCVLPVLLSRRRRRHQHCHCSLRGHTKHLAPQLLFDFSCEEYDGSRLHLRFVTIGIYFLERPRKLRLPKVQNLHLLAVSPGDCRPVWRTSGNKTQLRRGADGTFHEGDLLDVAAIIACRLDAVSPQFGTDIGGREQFVVRPAAAPLQSVAGQKFHVRTDASGTDLGRST